MPSGISNALAMLAARLVVPLFSFAINVAIARLWGAELLGTYVHLVVLLLLFQTMAGAGIPLFLAREIAGRGEAAGPELDRAAAVGLGSGALSALAYVVYVQWVLPIDEARPGLVLALAIVVSGWTAMQEGVFVGTRRHHLVTVIALVEHGLKLTLVAAAIGLGTGLAGLCSGLAVSRLAALVTGRWLLGRVGADMPWWPKSEGALPFARALAPFAAVLILSMLYFRIDVLVVHLLRGNAETGLYGSALTLYTAVLLLPDTVMSAIYPRLASAFRASRAGYADAMRLCAWLIATGIAPIALGLVCFAEPILVALYGERFRAAASPLRLLAASLPVHALNGAIGQGLQAGHLQAAMLRVVSVALGIHIVFTVVAVSALGPQGAALAVLLSSSVVTVGGALTFHRHIAPLALGARSVGSALPIAGPILLALLTPRAHAVVTVLALVWLGAGVAMQTVLHRADREQLARALVAALRA